MGIVLAGYGFPFGPVHLQLRYLQLKDNLYSVSALFVVLDFLQYVKAVSMTTMYMKEMYMSNVRESNVLERNVMNAKVKYGRNVYGSGEHERIVP